MANIVDIEELAERTRQEELRKIEQKVAAVRALGTAAARSAKLQDQLEQANADWSSAYRDAVDARLSERDLIKLKPTVEAVRRRARGTRTATVSDGRNEAGE